MMASLWNSAVREEMQVSFEMSFALSFPFSYHQHAEAADHPLVQALSDVDQRVAFLQAAAERERPATARRDPDGRQNRGYGLQLGGIGVVGGDDAEAFNFARSVDHRSPARHTGEKIRDLRKRRLTRRDDELALLVGAVANLEGIVESPHHL